jgi:hypothetical protein
MNWFFAIDPRWRSCWLCHVRGFYLSIGRGALARMSIFQCLRALVANSNRLGNRLFLANVTMPDGGGEPAERIRCGQRREPPRLKAGRTTRLGLFKPFRLGY